MVRARNGERFGCYTGINMFYRYKVLYRYIKQFSLNQAWKFLQITAFPMKWSHNAQAR